MATERELDVICIGRSSVDLYGQQSGGRLEDMASFAKSVGGSPTNIAIGASRLGLRAALITRVGDEHMGRFIRETLEAERVDTRFVVTDPERLTALVLLGIRDQHTFPLIFYRENCADMAISEEDIDRAFIASSRATLVTGTHFSRPQVAAASRRAMTVAREAERKVILDIDYRPNLWNLGAHQDGEFRFVADQDVTLHLQSLLPLCDLVVGTEEELHIAGGVTDTLDAIRRVRQLTDAVIVCKRGPMGCTAFSAQANDWSDGVTGEGFPVEIYNVLGAGDGFMAGFLSGWLRDQPLENCCRFANACGALAVSRLGCAPAYPSKEELEYFLANGSRETALRRDARLNRLHEATTRARRWDRLVALAFDHRSYFEKLAAQHHKGAAEIGRFKALVYRAAAAGADDDSGFGIFVDDQFGRDTLHQAASSGCWIGRPAELSDQFPLELEIGPDLGSALNEWPVTQTVKVRVLYRLDDSEDIRNVHDRLMVRLADACRRTRHELLVEIISSRPDNSADPDMVPGILHHVYDLDVFPDWWTLEPITDSEYWQRVNKTVAQHDPHLQGIIVGGREMSQQKLRAVFEVGARQPLVRGFAVGRSIFEKPAERWFAGKWNDDDAVMAMASAYRSLIDAWDAACQQAGHLVG